MNWEPIISLTMGAIIGFVFAFGKLPVPAPSNLSGLLGIAGLWAGYMLVGMIR